MEFKKIEINKVKPDPNQPRTKFNDEDLELMADSIVSQNVINPIEIDENNMIITGERRWRASKIAGLKEIPVKVVKGLSPEQRLERQLVENFHQKTVTVEQALPSIKSLLKCFNNESKKKGIQYNSDKGQKELAKRLGISESWLSKSLGYDSKATPELREARKKNEIGFATAVEMAIQLEPEEQKQVIRENEDMYRLERNYVRGRIKQIKRQKENNEKPVIFPEPYTQWLDPTTNEMRHLKSAFEELMKRDWSDRIELNVKFHFDAFHSLMKMSKKYAEFLAKTTGMVINLGYETYGK